MTMLPALNVIAMRDGSEAAFGKGYNVLPIWQDRMDSRTWVPTPNADVIYAMSYLDLKETGPLVALGTGAAVPAALSAVSVVATTDTAEAQQTSRATSQVTAPAT